MESKEINNLKDVIEVADYALENMHGNMKSTEAIWWRGHAKHDWKLRAKVFRENKGEEYETNIATKFVLKARSRHSNCPERSDIASWLFLMQHHGLPTRLLDWTESALIATYFAVCKGGNEDGKIWALNSTKMNLIRNGTLSNYASGHPDLRPSYGAVFDDKIKVEDKIFAILPSEVNERMMVQQSVFTLHNTPTHLEEDERHEEYLQGFQIPASSKPNLMRQLSQIGISVSNLFPDLDHLAEELSQLDF